MPGDEDANARSPREHEHQELERQLEELTRQLEESNRELDGFMYSVSHDLRAPLRAVDGFARVLVEDYAPLLDEEGKKVIDVIRKNTEKMGERIDALSTFARLRRQAARATPFDMTALVRGVAQEVTDPARSIDVRIAQLPDASGDPALVRQVWLHLVANAIKFSRARSPAIVEITASEESGFIVYVVKDNGVGFDQQYAKKLFGLFQRLHSEAEFEGNGVGLAIVDRIVRRHGGWVKVEGKLGEGATFSFALPTGASRIC